MVVTAQLVSGSERALLVPQPAFSQRVGLPWSDSIGSATRVRKQVSVDMSTGKPRPTAARHHLLPHERWVAEHGYRRGRAPQGSDGWRMQQNHGPEGMALLLAACADVFPGGLVVLAGIVLMVVAAFCGHFRGPRRLGSTEMAGRLYVREVADLNQK